MKLDEGYRKLVDDYDNPVDPRLPCFSDAWIHVPVVVMLGLGGHFSKNALAPAEPILAAMGLSPVAYAAISAMPVLGSFAFPTLWGLAYAHRERLVTLLVPLGILLSQVIMASGLAFDAFGTSLVASKAALALGLVSLSGFRAGAEVLQHIVLARLLRGRLTSGFATLVVSTHLTVMLCNFGVPQAAADSERPVLGLLRVQLWLLLPSLAGVLAAMWLLCHPLAREALRAPDPRLPSREPDLEDCASAALGDQAEGGSACAGYALVLWGALVVGLLHAMQSVTNGLVVSFGMGPEAAGNVIAKAQMVAMALLPVAGYLGDCLGRRSLVVVTSLLVLVGCLTLAQAAVLSFPPLAWRAALQSLTLAGVLAPVLPLALIPLNLQQPGRAYGVLDSLKSLTQALVMLLLGALRELGGFPAAMRFACLPLALLSVVLSITVAASMADSPAEACGRRRRCIFRVRGA